jgi:hypothetical protein
LARKEDRRKRKAEAAEQAAREKAEKRARIAKERAKEVLAATARRSSESRDRRFYGRNDDSPERFDAQRPQHYDQRGNDEYKSESRSPERRRQKGRRVLSLEAQGGRSLEDAYEDGGFSNKQLHPRGKDARRRSDESERGDGRCRGHQRRSRKTL